MRLVRMEKLLDKGPFSTSDAWAKIQKQIADCITGLEWPKGAGKFLLHDQPGKKRGEGSGVTPIKDGFIRCLKEARVAT